MKVRHETRERRVWRGSALGWLAVLAVWCGPAAGADDRASANGALRVAGTRLVNARGDAIQLRGMSSHGLHWYPQFTSRESILETKKRGANLFRLAMYADSVEGGYSESPETMANNKRLLYEGLENALAEDMYVIVDWHLLKDANPLKIANNAVHFFEEVTARYPNHPAIIYEICNEPNGGTTWEQIRTYAEIVIPVIRAASPDAVILVGTPKWSSHILAPLTNPLECANVMYSYHLYTGDTHYDFRPKLDLTRFLGLPVFVSEWGISTDRATGELDVEEGRAFIRYMCENNLSWANWSLSNKDEDFSALKPNVTTLSGWEDEDLTESGRLVFAAFQRSDTCR